MQTSLYIGSFGLVSLPPEATNMICIVVVKHASHCSFFRKKHPIIMGKKALHIPPLSVQAKGKFMQNRPEEQVFLRDGYFIKESVITFAEVTQV